jgi:predicted amidohydrolase YtcJ
MNGAGEMLVLSAADFEDFFEPSPDLPPVMEAELRTVIRHLVANRWPFRLHATYDETITRTLHVYEEVNRDIPLAGLHWFFDHCETISDRNNERIRALGGGIAVQNRMAFQGEYFVERYGAQQAQRTPPIRRMLEMGVPVGAGTGRACPVTTRSWHSTGLSPATQSEDSPCTLHRTASTAWRPCGCIRSAARGSPVMRAQKGRWYRDNWPTWRSGPPTTLPFPRKRSSGLNRY